MAMASSPQFFFIGALLEAPMATGLNRSVVFLFAEVARIINRFEAEVEPQILDEERVLDVT